MKPDIIVEIGSRYGGSTRYFADLLDIMGNGVVLSIDIDRSLYRCRHDRVRALTGSSSGRPSWTMPGPSAGKKGFSSSRTATTGRPRSWKTWRITVPSCPRGQYFIVEDSICHHGLDVGPNPGPYEAIEEFLRNHKDFESDRGRESFFITWNPKGYLKKRDVSEI